MTMEGTQLHEVTVFGGIVKNPKRKKKFAGSNWFIKPEVKAAVYIQNGGLNGA